MDWTPLDIITPAERGTVRQQRRKDGNKSVIYIEYRRDSAC